MYEKLPDDLKRNARFCLWKYETRKGKPTKVPYRTDGKRADSTKASDFSTFETVTSVLGRGGYDGIGMIIGGGFSAVDIDNCVTDGKLSETARDIVDTMDSYTETSLSGTGIRIIFDTDGADYDKARYYINNRNVNSFLALVKRYTEIPELTAEIIRSFVEKIEVFQPEKIPGTRTKKQTVRIHWNYIGVVEIPERSRKTA